MPPRDELPTLSPAAISSQARHPARWGQCTPRQLAGLGVPGGGVERGMEGERDAWLLLPTLTPVIELDTGHGWEGGSQRKRKSQKGTSVQLSLAHPGESILLLDGSEVEQDRSRHEVHEGSAPCHLSSQQSPPESSALTPQC